MAEEEKVAQGAGNFLTHKVGPLPLGVWMAAAVVIYLYLKKKNTASTSSGAQTDPAGNVGAIDPATGYVYGSPQDVGARGSQDSTGASGDTSGSGGSTTAGQYADNNAWARAAINFLVGVGVDPTEANSAITQYIGSQTLTTQQQADVNLAIQSIGAPPTPPAPGNAPPPVVTPPHPGTVYADNPPSGLTVSAKSANSITLKWNRSTNATGYVVSYNTGSQPVQSTTVSGTNATVTLSGLQGGALYSIKVQATPAKSGAPSATTTATTTGSSGGSGATVKPGMVLSVPYNVAPGQAAAVASKFGISLQHLLNSNPGKTGKETTLQVYNIPFLVKPGETNSSVAAKFGISVAHLQQYIPAS